MTTETPNTERPPLKEAPPWDLVLKRNFVERLKREKFPLEIRDEVPRLIEEGYERISEDDVVRLQWWELFLGECAARGVLFRRGGLNFVTYAHTAEDVAEATHAAAEAFDVLRTAGFGGRGSGAVQAGNQQVGPMSGRTAASAGA